MIARAKQRLFSLWNGASRAVAAPPFVALAPFRSRPAPLSSALRKTTFFAFCIFLGVFYGFWGSVLPPAFIILLVIPFLIFAMLVLWVLPDTSEAPAATLRKLLMAFTAVTFLWPNYLAIVLPGLPWLSMRRIVGLAMVAVFLFSLSTSSKMRREIIDTMNSIPLVWKLIVAFFAVQTISIGFSIYPVLAYKHWFNSQYAWTTVFFLSIFVFVRPGNFVSWAKLISVSAVIVSLIAIAEQRNQMVLWANHIPTFLQIEDSAVERILRPNFRSGQYRSQAIFGVSLAMAEYLALAFTLVLHRLMSTQRNLERMALIMAMAAIVTGVAMSRARVGFVGIVVGMALYFFIWGYRRYRDKKTDVIGAAMTYGYPAIMAVSITLILTVDALRFRILGSGTVQASNDAREIQFEMAPPVIAGSPVFGYGGGRGADALGYTNPAGEITLDTYILSIVLDYGVVGFLIFYGAIAVSLFYVGRASLALSSTPKDRDEEEIGYLLPLGVMLAQFWFIKTVLSQEENHSILFMIYGAVLALYWRLRQREMRQESTRFPAR